SLKVKFYGRTIKRKCENGTFTVDWVDTEDVLAMAYDTPIPGYKNDVVNNLRLWSARSTEEFDLDYFHDGDYIKACENKIVSENISRVLYPSDSVYQGMELRLKQEYFFTSASIHDIIRRFKVHNADFKDFPDKVAIQLNDTHPAIAIVELMRILLDEENIEWSTVWDLAVRTFAYTNHTIMFEALEAWPVDLIGKLLPRHLEIIYEINNRFLGKVADRYPGDKNKMKRMSLIDEEHGKKVRMSHLCVIGSHSVNGVSKLHTELLKTSLFKDFYELYPERFNSKTNGITQRRWLKKANPSLAKLVTGVIGDGWIRDLKQLEGIAPYAEDASFRKKWEKSKIVNKTRLAEYIKSHTGIIVDTSSLFDAQIKRIHEYKRQTLFALYLIARYVRIKNGSRDDNVPRTAIVAGKAAPGYVMAKLVIKFINNIAQVINNDPAVGDKLKVVFLEDYGVSLAEKIFPATNLSEQISTAGREASGTGNMKFMLNGAVTIGTLDGANIEIAEEVGQENIFIFGLKVDEIIALRSAGYNPADYVKGDPLLAETMDMLRGDAFSIKEKGIFEPILSSLLGYDEYMVLADFSDYFKAQNKVSRAYSDRSEWTRKSILNTAKGGNFSSDRTIMEYAGEIWGV
ncbi:MAG: glycogen/starch/alpha-glucan phosphorylase, partial [Candidatus Omnitrophica bacterium]|nr:glycogen/starch/alpha-glucan phosphorylase [Candidatus Omnitrophota bacterium]